MVQAHTFLIAGKSSDT